MGLIIKDLIDERKREIKIDYIIFTNVWYFDRINYVVGYLGEIWVEVCEFVW